MTDGGELIVNFRKPPVVEVVAGVALEGMTNDAAAYVAAFWKERLRKEFPRLESQAPYSPPQENFTGVSQGHEMSFEFGVGVPPVRLLASSADGTLHVQLQPGWFACNWRRVQPSDEYDHWPARRDAFSHWFQEFLDFLDQSGLPRPRVRQAEVTYVNHITPNAVWTSHKHFSRIFQVDLGATSAGRLEQVSAQAQYLLDGSPDEGPIGRLHVKLLPALARDGRTPLYVLELTARGPATGQTGDAVVRFLDRGRAAIVQAFQDLSRPEMRKQWEEVP